ncbi:hypothetical protein DMUE_0450 [Dictyocoela muelleri]|nr:hypothetical protein DMUE_0450 [Dictyocoela muelleri]
MNIVLKPNECVALDIKGPIKTCHFISHIKRRYFYLLVMTDVFSRYTETVIINNIETQTILVAFDKKWISVHVPPLKCLTDNGRQFISDKFEQLLKSNGIIHIKSSPNIRLETR